MEPFIAVRNDLRVFNNSTIRTPQSDEGKHEKDFRNGGGLVGCTAGPSIARSWGLHHHRYHHRHYAERDRAR